MGNYGEFYYGGPEPGVGGDYYGTGIAVDTLTWYFGVFWDDAFVDEVSRLTNLSTDRGREHLLATGGNGWERFKVGEASATFDNSDGRYDPYNTSGPLYGFLLPGRVVRITVAVTPQYSDITTTFNVLRGIIDDIRTGIKNGRREATIIVKDGLEWLNRRSIALALVEDAEALITAAAIAAQVGFDDVDDWAISQLGTDSLVVPFAFGNSNSAIELINEFVDAEAGQVFHGADGVLYFITNDYTQEETIDIDDAQGHILRDFELKSPWEVVRTRAQVTVQPFVAGSSVIVWTFGVDDSGVTGTPRLHMDGGVTSISVDAIFDLDGPFASPSASSIYAELDPPGSDVSLDINVSMVDIGTGLRLTFERDGATLGAGLASDVYIYYVEISASPYERANSVIVLSSDAPAIVIYGEKTFVLDNPWIQDTTYAQEYADYVVNELKAAKLFPTIVIENRGLLQYSPELYVSKVHLTIPALGIDDTFRVGKIAHKWLNNNGYATQTTLRLEPVLGVL